jgi:hypothetical protein
MGVPILSWFCLISSSTALIYPRVWYHKILPNCHWSGFHRTIISNGQRFHRRRNKYVRHYETILGLGRLPPDSDSWLEHSTSNVLDVTRIPLGRLTTDDVETIAGLMAAWARKKSDQAALKVESLLKRVVDDRNAGNRSVKVTTRMYTMAIDAWAKASRGVQAAVRANEIHNNMKRIYQETHDESIRPTTVSYNAVINSWSKCADPISPYKAEDLLKEMIYGWRVMGDDAIKPDVVSFTSCIDAWAKSGEDKASEKALALFHTMEQLYNDENEHSMKPNGKVLTIAFTNIPRFLS